MTGRSSFLSGLFIWGTATFFLPAAIGQDGARLSTSGGIDGASPSVQSDMKLNVETSGPPSDRVASPTPKPPVEVDTHGKGISQIFELGNEAYEADDLERAVAYYRAIEDRGLVNGYLYFNLGNAYFRMGDFGHAVLYFEKAKKHRPRDPDLVHNLNYARTFLIDKKTESDKLPGSLETILILHRQTTRNETFWLFAILNLLLAGCLIAKTLRFRFTQRVYFGYLQGAVVALFVLQAVSAGFKVWDEDRIREAVVLEDSVKATASPTSRETLYELNAGTEVDLHETRDGFSRISWNGVPAFVPEGLIGEI